MWASPIEELLRRDRAIVVCALAAITILAWVYLIGLSRQMELGHSMGEIFKLKPWKLMDALMMFLMWTVMMVGMMLPSATPMILLYGRVLRNKMSITQPFTFMTVFLSGYLTVWTLFSGLATAIQWTLEQQALLSPMMVTISPAFSGAVLITAGVYQWSPYKMACLKKCRSPVWFLANHWRNGIWGAFLMGLEHGLYCLGCCWALMMLLFVGGVMNLLCVASISVFVLLEKAAPFGRDIGRLTAPILVFLGLYVMLVV